MVNMKRSGIIVISLMFLASCGMKQSPSLKKKRENRYIAKRLDAKTLSALDSVRLQEAKMVDIPIPLSAEPLPEYFDPTNPTIMLGYEDTTLSPSGIEDFYIREMERLGWQAKEQFIGYESILRFTNPEQRSCLISVRLDEERQCTCFVIATGTKELFLS